MSNDTQPKKTTKVIQQFKYPMQHTHFRKHHVMTGVTQFIGRKPLVDELCHADVIGKNKSICKKLYTVGALLIKHLGYDIGLGMYDNHVWLPQLDEGDSVTRGSVIHVCLNCGSVMAAREFVGNYESDVDINAQTFKEVKNVE